MNNSQKHQHNGKFLEEIWEQVPVDYYQKSVRTNFLQRTWHLNKLNQVVKAIKENKIQPETILDVGCASGWFLNEVSKKFSISKCIGVDVYKEAINHGEKSYKNLNFIHTDAEKLPFKNKTFDIITCCEVLEHVTNVEKVLQEMKRVLKNNGTLIIEIDSGNLLFRIIWYWWTNIRRGVWRDAHLHSFNVQTLDNLFIKNGFKIKRKKIFNLTMAVIFTLTV